jgi:hypothetical protein
LADEEVVRIGYNIVFQTGILKEACRDWTWLAVSRQTLDKFKVLQVQTISPKELSALMVELAMYRSAAAANQVFCVIEPSGTPAQVSYCWSHGVSSNMAHTSSTCCGKLLRHQDTTAESNKLGGSTKNWSASDRKPR